MTFAMPEDAVHINMLGMSHTVGRMIRKGSCIVVLLCALSKEVSRLCGMRTEEISLINDRGAQRRTVERTDRNEAASVKSWDVEKANTLGIDVRALFGRFKLDWTRE